MGKVFVSGSIKGAEKLRKKAERMADIFENARTRAVQDATFQLHETAVRLVSDTSDGTPQLRYNPKRTVNASAPGDPPNSDTGRLRQSINFAFSSDGATGMVGSNLKYAAYLEFGTEDMAPRPWLSTALELVSKNIDATFEKWMAKAVQKVRSES